MIPSDGSRRLDLELLEVYFLKFYFTSDNRFLKVHDIKF